MRVSPHTISALGSVITGDGGLSPYRSGPDLVSFFNQFERDDEYDRGFPSRWSYAESCLNSLNDSDHMTSALLASVDPRHFIETKSTPQAAVDHLNQYLEYDGYQLLPKGKAWDVCPVAESVELSTPYPESAEVTHVFITEQIEKCTNKLDGGDYDGAITNARSLLEAILVTLESEFDSAAPTYDGNLPRLYKRVQKHLNLSPGQDGLADCLRQILSGMTSIVNGLASLRNAMGDSHVVSYRPSKHHAQLAVNCARTVARFLFETKEHQVETKEHQGRREDEKAK